MKGWPPIVVRILYVALLMWLPVGFTLFLTYYDLTNFVSSNSIALINIANAAMTSEEEFPIVVQLVVYYLNDTSRYVMWSAMGLAVAFKIFIHFSKNYRVVSFPQQAERLRTLGVRWMVVSAIIALLVAVGTLYPIARNLLMIGQSAASLVVPAWIVALSNSLGYLGTIIASVFLGVIAIIKVLGFFLPQAVLSAAIILLLVFLVTYYCTSLALTYQILPRITAPLEHDTALLGWLRNRSLAFVGVFLRLGLDAAKGAEAAEIVAEIASEYKDGTATA